MPPPVLTFRFYPRPVLLPLVAVALLVNACSGAGAASPLSISTPVATVASASPSAAASESESSAPSPIAVTLPSPAPLDMAWQASGPVGAQTSTMALAVNPTNGQVWVAVPFENRWWIFAPDGTYLESWGSGGTAPGEFDLNDHELNADGFGAVAFAPDGSFYVGDVGNHRVEKFDAQRAFVKEWGSFGSGDGQFAQITAMATDGTTVYVGDGGRGDIQAFDVDGTYLRTFGGDGQFGAFITVDEAYVYATDPGTADHGSVGTFDGNGNEVARFSLPSGTDAVGVAVASDGTVYVGTATQVAPYLGLGVYELSPDGEPLRGWSLGGGESLGLSPDGAVLYVSRGIQLGVDPWTYIQAYEIPGA